MIPVSGSKVIYVLCNRMHLFSWIELRSSIIKLLLFLMDLCTWKNCGNLLFKSLLASLVANLGGLSISFCYRLNIRLKMVWIRSVCRFNHCYLYLCLKRDISYVPKTFNIIRFVNAKGSTGFSVICAAIIYIIYIFYFKYKVGFHNLFGLSS